MRDAADRPRFERWYADEHLRDAVKAFKVRRAWRGWSPWVFGASPPFAICGLP